MLELAIKLIVKFLYGMTSAQWKAAIALVKVLATEHMTNPQRASKFFAWFKTQWPTAEDRAIEKTRDLARDFARRKGWIHT